MKTILGDRYLLSPLTARLRILAVLAALFILPALTHAATVGQNWYWANPQPQGNLLDGITTNGAGTYVAVGRHGTVLTSSDLMTWTVQTTGTTAGLNAVAWGHNEFVAVSQSGSIITSPDGVTWTPQISPTTASLNAIIWSGSQFVAVGNLGVILTSPDGVSWTSRSSGITNYLEDITWSGTQFVAVGDSGTILTSLDGISWTTQTSGTTQYLEGIAWSGTQFVAVGYSGAVLTSSNGTSWTTAVANLTSSGFLMHVFWGNGYFVVIDNYGDTYTSLDGSSWSTHYLNIDVSDARWNGSQWVGVGAGGAIYTSADAVTWTLQNPGVTASVSPRASLQNIVWTGSEFIALSPNVSNQVLVSADGASWSLRSLGGNYAPNDAACSATLCVAVGMLGDIITSPDAVTWTPQSSPVPITTVLRAVIWDGTQFVAVGDGGVILTSPAGTTWTIQGSGVTTANLKAVTAGGGALVAVGNAGAIVTSTNGGTIWTSQSTSSTDSFTGVTYGASTFLAVGSNAQPYTSADGLSWKAMTRLSNYVYSVIWAGSQFVAVDATGSIFTSPGASTWTQQASGNSNILEGIAWNGDTQIGAYVAVGINGTILVSAPAGAAGTSAVTITQPNTGSETFNVSGIGALTVTAHSSDQTLLPDANITGAGACTAMGSCSLTLQAGAYQSGTATVTVTVTDSKGQTGSASFGITVNPPPAPTISGVSNLPITQPNSGTETFSITGTGLGVNVQSDNPTLLPATAITGASACTTAGTCTLTLQPVAGQTGSAIVTMFVGDTYAQSASAAFTVTVNPPAPPAITGTSSVTITGTSGTETFTLAGVGALTLSAHSTDQTLLPDANISGSGACTAAGNCTLTVQPVAGQTGSAAVNLTVSDAYGQSATGNFSLTVSATAGSGSSSGSGSGSSGGGGGAFGLWGLLGLLGLCVLAKRRLGAST